MEAAVGAGFDGDHRALAIDHVYGDGAAARRSGMLGRRLLRDVLVDIEGQYQLLCANCNQIKQFENAERVGTRV